MKPDLEAEWEPQEPPPSFADRVVAHALHDQRATRRRRRYLAVAATTGLAAAAAVAVFVAVRRPPSTGDIQAAQRVEVPIGSRAVAVLEAGAHITWAGDTVTQDRGDVFYRVEPGSTFQVHTPTAEARVLGTCFRISIDNKENVMKRRDLGAGALGAVTAVAVVVGVYEGMVKVSHGAEAVTVRAGETAVADGSGVRAASLQVARSTASGDDSAKLARTDAELKERLAAIEQEKAALEKELASAYEGSGKSPWDLSKDDWAKLAEQGAFKYRLPCHSQGGFRPSAAQLEQLGLAPKDADPIQAAYRNASHRFATSMTAICAAVSGGTGDAKDLAACITNLFVSAYSEGPDSARKLFTQIGEIRAGKRPEPKPEDMSPQMKMLMFFSGEMKTFEDELAKTFGPDEAHRIAYSEELCFKGQSF